MSDRLHSELYASIATLDQLKRMYDVGLVDLLSFRRESEVLLTDVRENIETLRRSGFDLGRFFHQERIPESFPDASGMLSFSIGRTENSKGPVTTDEYYNDIGLAVLDVATANASKGFIGLAELIVEVVHHLPQYRNITYNDVIEAVNKVAGNGLIPGIRTLRGGVKVVGLRPVELSADQADVISLATMKGHVTVEEVMLQMKWSEDHARQVLMSLVEAGMAVADIRFSTGGRYHFPGLKPRDDHSP
jgi:hypothetical protein